MNNQAKEIIQLLKDSRKPILTMDSRADFDALCSAIIIHQYLTQTLKKNLRVTFDGNLTDSIKDIAKDYADIGFVEEGICPTTDIDFSQYDLQIFLDSGNIEHICKDRLFKPKSEIPRLNIDHHQSNPSYGHYNYLKYYTACCSTMFNLFQEAGIEWDKGLANIYCLGILMDSGFFQYNTVTAYDFWVAFELVKNGAKSFEIAWKLTFNEKLVDLKSAGLIYNNMVVVPEKRLAYSTISLKELQEKGIDYEQISFPPSDRLKRLEGVDFVFVVREFGDERFNVSLRSHLSDFNVLEIAQKLSLTAGGHIMAAGASISAENLQEAVKKVLGAI